MSHQIQGKPTPVRWVGHPINLPPEEFIALMLGNVWITAWDYMLVLGAAAEVAAVLLGAPIAGYGDSNVNQSGSESAGVTLGTPTAAYAETFVWKSGSESAGITLGTPTAAYDYMLVLQSGTDAGAVILGTPTPANG